VLFRSSRLLCTLQPSPYKGDHLPPAPDVTAHLCRIWEIRVAQPPPKKTAPRDRPVESNSNGAPATR
jgi:hypothetical protein